MRKAIFALAVLAAGCAGGPEPEPEVVTVHHHREQTQVVAKQQVEVSPSLRLVGEAQPLAAPTNPVPQVQIQIQPQATIRPTGPTTRQMAQQALQRIDQLEQTPPKTEVYFLQVGPPVVLNTPTAPATAPAPTPTYQAAVPPPLPPAPTPAPVLETAQGFNYQNGGVMGSTAPMTTPTPALPTAEGFQYQP